MAVPSARFSESGQSAIFLSANPDKSQLKVTAFNGHIELAVFLPCQEVSGAWSVGVPNLSLARIFSGGEPGIRVEAYESELFIFSGGAKYRLPIIESENSPYIHIKEARSIGTVFYKSLLRSLSSCLPKESANERLQFARIFSDGGMTKAWASDNRIFIQKTLGPTEENFSILICQRALEAMAAFEYGKLSVAPNGGIFEVEGARLKFAAGATEYPDLGVMARLMPKINSLYKFDGAKFREVYESVKAVAFHEPSAPIIDFKYSGDHFEVKCQSTHGKSEASLPIAEIIQSANSDFSLSSVSLGKILDLSGDEIYMGITPAPAPIFFGPESFRLGQISDFLAAMPINRPKWEG